MIRRALLVLAASLALASLARAQAPEPAPDPGRVAVDAVAGLRDLDVRRASGPFTGVRTAIRVAPRARLRLGVEHADGRDGASLLVAEAGCELEVVRRGRLRVGVIGSALHVNGKASDAEEWDRIVRPWGLRAAISSSIRLGSRAHLAVEAGLTRYQARDGQSVAADGPGTGGNPDDAHDVLGIGWDVSVGVGWTLGRQGQPRVQAIE
jgi:hypothetical protein